MKIQRLDPSRKKEIRQIRESMFDKFRNVPERGKDVDYMGESFVVYPSVFWPQDDSIPLVENYAIRNGESVLDVCTGAGNIAIMSAYRGAGSVVALEVNPQAVRAARENVRRHGFEDVVWVRHSDMFDVLRGEKFDVITANLPFENGPARDVAEHTVYDPSFDANTKFFAEVGRHLKPRGRAYISQANFGDVDSVLKLAKKHRLSANLIGERDMQDGLRIFYAFELRKMPLKRPRGRIE